MNIKTISDVKETKTIKHYSPSLHADRFLGRDPSGGKLIDIDCCLSTGQQQSGGSGSLSAVQPAQRQLASEEGKPPSMNTNGIDLRFHFLQGDLWTFIAEQRAESLVCAQPP